jgi:hypothetical protein
LLRRPAPSDTPERLHKSRQAQDPGVSVAENADRAIFGAWSAGHPGNKPTEHR